jgi:hypothetical protein
MRTSVRQQKPVIFQFPADRAQVNPRAMTTQRLGAWHSSLIDRYQPTQPGNSPRPFLFAGM